MFALVSNKGGEAEAVEAATMTTMRRLSMMWR